MKKIEAIIRPDRLPTVRRAIEEAGYPGMTITNVYGHGTQKGIVEQYKGTKYTVDILPKVKIEIVVADEAAPRLVKTLVEAARTGQIGDGKVFVSTIDDAIRVRTGESGKTAL